LGCDKLFKINKNIQDTLSLCVTRSGSPMSFMSFVDFSQFNLRFCEFRIYFMADNFKIKIVNL